MPIDEQAEYWTAEEAAGYLGMKKSTFTRAFLPIARARGHKDLVFQQLIRADLVKAAQKDRPGSGNKYEAKVVPGSWL